MVKVCIVARVAGKTSPETSFIFDLPEIPRVGDCISIGGGPNDKGPLGKDFIARKVWWRLEHPTEGGDDPDGPVKGKLTEIQVECDIAEGPYSSGAHRRAVKAAKAKGIEVELFGIARQPYLGDPDLDQTS